MPFFVIFIVVPLMELAVFALVSNEMGLGNALLFALLTAIIGGAVIRHQGMSTIFKIRQALDRGKIPIDEIFDGFCLVAAGATLITPGFITDTIGFLLLMPPVRAAIRHLIKTHTDWAVTGESSFQGRYTQDPTVIEAEWEQIDENEPGSGDDKV
ncbi:MAG: FxsA family protein [Alphaproteobacteria bacterium]